MNKLKKRHPKRDYKWAADELEKMAAGETDPQLRALWNMAAGIGRRKAAVTTKKP